jgi:alpha-L-fucosidase
MNESWGYNPADDDYKTPRAIVHALCETAGRGGNLLLNVSPRGDGSLPPEQVERLEALAAWMGRHADALHGSSAGLEAWQFYGPTTRKGDRVFCFLLSRPYETVSVRGVKVRRVERVSLVGSGQRLEWEKRVPILGRLLDDPTGELVIQVPERALDPFASVIEIAFSSSAPGMAL